ncbi:hypothetical protein EDF66_10345 [Sphingobacterium sp. JUb20]|nr:hypothetical protein EDF66_10345 [Sphingobacterium sp. JUb20]
MDLGKLTIDYFNPNTIDKNALNSIFLINSPKKEWLITQLNHSFCYSPFKILISDPLSLILNQSLSLVSSLLSNFSFPL